MLSFEQESKNIENLSVILKITIIVAKSEIKT